MIPRALLSVALFLVSFTLRAEKDPSSSGFQSLGDANFSGWTGLEVQKDGAVLKSSSPAQFCYPESAKGWYIVGFKGFNEGTRDWRGFYGLQFDVQVPVDRKCDLQAVIAQPQKKEPKDDVSGTKAVMALSGSTSWQHITLPWTVFDFKKSQGGGLEFVQTLQLSAKFVDGKEGELKLKNIRLVRAPVIALDAPACGKAAPAGTTVHYVVTVTNCTDRPQTVKLLLEKYGFEAMPVSVEPEQLPLAPGAFTKVMVSVTIPKEGIPPGGHESQKLIAVGNGDGAALAKLELVTACDVPRPSIQMTAQGWAEVRDKVKHYEWAKRAQDDFIKAADAWQVPQVATPEEKAKNSEGHIYVFRNDEFRTLPKAAIAWQLTRDKKYAEKAALFLRRLADEKEGYPATFAGTNMGPPQEGENFQSVAIAYDAILDADVLSVADKSSIERMFRIFMENCEGELHSGNMGNWTVASTTACLFCSLAMGDLAAAEHYIKGPAGFDDYLSKSIMDDGWWWECSTSYNFWVASELTQCALACKPWGIDLLNYSVPASYSPFAIITPWALNPPYGMSFEKWGPNHRNNRSIKMLWDAIPTAADYRGIAFGINDGHEQFVAGPRAELAYYAFRDPAYLSLIREDKRDLIYGVPELPQTTAKPYLQSSCAENLGVAILRSQTEKREPREQIEAVFKIGTQGGYHGHFDRVSLNTIMRYGRSFWNPESIWYGYAHHMYKFYVQPSVSHNMVVVDQKQQEAVPSSQLLFHSGKMMQAVVHETNARWCDPPYGGLVPSATSSGGAVASLPDRMKMNRASFPLVNDRKWGDLGPYGDRVLQRRLGIVTDDYIVVADYLKSEKPHVFDNLFQMKGFTALEAKGKKLVRHDAQFNADPHSAAQFVTDCDWYQATAPALAKFAMNFEQGNEYNEPGPLKIDVRSVWPKQQEIMIAQPPEVPETSQWVNYEFTGDGKSLAKGESGMWVLGQADIDLPVQGVNELALNITADGKAKKNSLFLANARWVTASGQEIPIAAPAASENIVPIAKTGQDYYGGPIKIAGTLYDAAIPVQPQDATKAAILHISLAGKNAVRFKATLGGDYPVGNESDRRKVLAIRSQGTEANFLTVLEPYENEAMVKSVSATGPDALTVELADGRTQVITIKNLAAGKDIAVEITETKSAQMIRHETSLAAAAELVK